MIKKFLRFHLNPEIKSFLISLAFTFAFFRWGPDPGGNNSLRIILIGMTIYACVRSYFKCKPNIVGRK